jgi:hypothetical protein
MSFRRTGHSDERRRRVLMEDTSAAPVEGEAAPAAKQRKAKTRTYSDAALASNQAPVTAIVPARPWTLSVLALSGLVCIALLNLLNAELPRLARWVGIEHLDAINFAVRGNLAAWLSSFWLAWAAVMSAKLFNLRRHRVDDYKGRYRIWIWTTVLLVCASLDAGTGLHDAIGGLMVRLSGKAQTLSATICWLTAGAALIGAVSLRMAIEMRRSKAALVSLLFALVCYTTAALVRIGWLPLEADLGWHALVTATLLGHGAIWFTTLSYARYVYLDSQNLLAVKKPKEPKAKKKKEEKPSETADKDAKEATTSDGKQIRIDGAHGDAAKPAATGGPLKAAMISSATVKSPAADDRRMSKAERKKLRRQNQDEDEEE